jgi:ABC-type antimicrobial peptide transport system permease subunit
MAVGARPIDILTQFLAEATVLALGGWTAGTIAAAAGGVALAVGTEWRIALPVDALVASIAMALVIGLGFGALPARRAARLAPVEALGTGL